MTNADQNSNYISGKTGDWEIVIGLEIHAQVLSSSKLFSGASTEFGKDPNHNVSLVDAAMPGMLPVINQTCINNKYKSINKLLTCVDNNKQCIENVYTCIQIITNV